MYLGIFSPYYTHSSNQVWALRHKLHSIQTVLQIMSRSWAFKSHFWELENCWFRNKMTKFLDFLLNATQIFVWAKFGKNWTKQKWDKQVNRMKHLVKFHHDGWKCRERLIAYKSRSTQRNWVRKSSFPWRPMIHQIVRLCKANFAWVVESFSFSRLTLDRYSVNHSAQRAFNFL